MRIPTSTGLRPSVSALLVASLAAAVALIPLPARATDPLASPFYRYDGSVPLAEIAPGTVLQTRTVPYHVTGFPLPLETVQLLYRSTSQTGRPTVNVTTVIRPLVRLGAPRVVSYQSFYDSLNPADQPSATIAGGLTLGGAGMHVETALFAPLLLAGYTINVSDTQGQRAVFGAGPEYGMNTLDSLRAIMRSTRLALPRDTKIGLIGYSGGAIASEWAAEMVEPYAPELAPNIVGTSIGGVLVNPARNLHYVEKSLIWAGMVPMAGIGLTRAFEVDPLPYLNERGVALMRKMETAAIVNVLGQYPGLDWTTMAKPEFSTPERVPLFVDLAKKVIMSRGGTPTAPMLIAQGTGGALEGTRGDKPGIGAGDGVMIAGDVRSLARAYCGRGVPIEYRQLNGLSHFMGVAPWIAMTIPWIQARFAGRAPTSTCAAIPTGNPEALKPIALQR